MPRILPAYSACSPPDPNVIRSFSKLRAGVHGGEIARGGAKKDVYLKDGIKTYRGVSSGAAPDIILFGSGYWCVSSVPVQDLNHDVRRYVADRSA